MSNYIHRLQDQNAAKDRKIEALEQGIRDLRSHLHSSKFHQDTTVQVQDVLLRLHELEHAATDALHFTEKV